MGRDMTRSPLSGIKVCSNWLTVQDSDRGAAKCGKDRDSRHNLSSLA